MENETFTPGPWEVKPWDGYEPIVIREDHGEKWVKIATLELFVRMAKGRLIAAAPDMLAALREIEKGEGEYSRDPLTHAKNTIEAMKKLAKDAISKATES